MILLLLLSACSASGPAFSPMAAASAGTSVIYLYRPALTAGSAAAPPISLDTRDVGKLENGGYLRMETQPGDHTLAIREQYDFVTLHTWPHANISVHTEPDRTYFIRYTTGATVLPLGVVTVATFTYHFQQVPETIGLPEIQQTRLSQ